MTVCIWFTDCSLLQIPLNKLVPWVRVNKLLLPWQPSSNSGVILLPSLVPSLLINTSVNIVPFSSLPVSTLSVWSSWLPLLLLWPLKAVLPSLASLFLSLSLVSVPVVSSPTLLPLSLNNTNQRHLTSELPRRVSVLSSLPKLHIKESSPCSTGASILVIMGTVFASVHVLTLYFH